MSHRLRNDRANVFSPADFSRGGSVAAVPFAVLSGTLARELECAGPRPLRPLLSGSAGICPLDILALFAPERRIAVLSEGLSPRDRVHAAAVRAARVLFRLGTPSGKTLAWWDRQVREIREHFLTAEGTGLLAFIRHGLDGGPGSEAVKFLREETCWNGYELVETVGRGGTSLAFLAVKDTGSCVLKMPLPGRACRFRREIRFLKCIRHPNLPELSASSTGKRPYCVMEVFRTGRGADSGAAAGFRNALDYLHGRRLLHGDIRRSNLGFRADGRAVLFDLSHARRVRTREETEEEMNKLNLLLRKEYAG